MKLLLAFVMGAVCVYALRRKPEAVQRPVVRMRWPRLVSIEDVEDGFVQHGDPDVIGIMDRDGRRLSWRDYERVDAV